MIIIIGAGISGLTSAATLKGGTGQLPKKMAVGCRMIDLSGRVMKIVGKVVLNHHLPKV